MRWNPDEYLEQIYRTTVPKYSYKASNKNEWIKWREELKREFARIIGLYDIEKAQLIPRLIDQKEYDTYIRQKISITTTGILEMPLYVLIPKKVELEQKLPAIIACSGHGYGNREIVGLNPDDTENTGDPGYQKNFALELVKRGFFVIAPEMLGFGDRRLKEDEDKPMSHTSCYHASTYLLMMGLTMTGMRVYETMRAVDYLLTRKEVDAERIGCIGISGGGLVCAFTTALDERIKAAVVSGYVNTFKDSVMAIYHCVDNFIPGIIKYAEMPDIISLIAPRPLLIEAGTKDDIFPVHAVRNAVEQIKKVYELAGGGEKLDTDIFEGGHQISGRKSYAWFEKWL